MPSQFEADFVRMASVMRWGALRMGAAHGQMLTAEGGVLQGAGSRGLVPATAKIEGNPRCCQLAGGMSASRGGTRPELHRSVAKPRFPIPGAAWAALSGLRVRSPQCKHAPPAPEWQSEDCNRVCQLPPLISADAPWTLTRLACRAPCLGSHT